MYICVCIFIYVYISIYLYIYMCVYIHTCIYTPTRLVVCWNTEKCAVVKEGLQIWNLNTTQHTATPFDTLHHTVP